MRALLTAFVAAIAASNGACRAAHVSGGHGSAATAIPDVGSGGCPPLAPISGFITRDDAALMVERNTAFRGAGTNLYYLQQLLAYTQQDGNETLLRQVHEALDDMVCLSLGVVRIWGFNDSRDRSSIRYSPWEGFREEGLRGLDQAVWEARRRGIRLIISLVNNWPEYGGLDAYAAWSSKLHGVPRSHDDFFFDPQMQMWWKELVSMLANRVNTFTGVAYRDEPAILAWEVGNELRCAACRGSTRLVDTIADLAGFLKGTMPRHLVADGSDGFDDDPGAWLGLSNLYPVQGSEGASFSRLAQIDALDMLSYHFYPHGYGLTGPDDAELWITHHQAIAMAAGKVAYLGEYSQLARDSERAQLFDGWMRHLFVASDGPLGVVWQLIPRGRFNNDGFGVYSRQDSATATILARWGASLR